MNADPIFAVGVLFQDPADMSLGLAVVEIQVADRSTAELVAEHHIQKQYPTREILKVVGVEITLASAAGAREGRDAQRLGAEPARAAREAGDAQPQGELRTP